MEVVVIFKIVWDAKIHLTIKAESLNISWKQNKGLQKKKTSLSKILMIYKVI